MDGCVQMLPSKVYSHCQAAAFWAEQFLNVKCSMVDSQNYEFVNMSIFFSQDKD